MEKSQIKLLVLFTLIAIFSGVVGLYTFSARESTSFIMKGGYWMILLTFCIFLYAFYSILKIKYQRNKARLKIGVLLNKHGLLIIAFLFVATCFSRVHEENQFKIVMDEPSLAGTAMSMHLHRQAMVPLRAYHIQGHYSILGGFVDKRPLFFPFLTSTLHDLTGYRISNSFYLNTLLTFAFFSLIYIFGRELSGSWGGILGVLLFLTLPLVYHTSNGGGFELLNLTMILAVMLASLKYLREPNKFNLSFLCLSGVLLSQTRYESIIYLVPLGLIILLGWLKKRRIITSWGFMISPILLIPYLWGHRAFEVNKSFWQLYDKPEAQDPFSVNYLYENLGHACNFFFNLSKQMPNSLILSVLGLVCLIFFLLYFYKKVKKPQVNNIPIPFLVLGVFLIGFFINFILLMTYFYGQLDNFIIQRLSLPLFIPLVFSIVWLFFSYLKKIIFKKLIYGFSILYFITFTIPTIAEHSYSNYYLPLEEVKWILNYTKNHPYDDNPYMVISEKTVLWTLNHIDAVSIGVVEDRKDALKYYLNQPGNPPVFVSQTASLNINTGRYEKVEHLGDDFILEPISYHPIGVLRRIEFSKLVDITHTKTTAPKDELTNEAYLEEWAKNLP